MIKEFPSLREFAQREAARQASSPAKTDQVKRQRYRFIDPYTLEAIPDDSAIVFPGSPSPHERGLRSEQFAGVLPGEIGSLGELQLKFAVLWAEKMAEQLARKARRVPGGIVKDWARRLLLDVGAEGLRQALEERLRDPFILMVAGLNVGRDSLKGSVKLVYLLSYEEALDDKEAAQVTGVKTRAYVAMKAKALASLGVKA